MASPVLEFYKGRKVFITGPSGFMGKVLIEKLLYSCTEINTVYILVRPKKGKSPEARLEDMWKLPMFWRIREQKPEAMKKVVPIQGDVLLDDLGIGASDLREIQNEVSVFFHFAATLRLEAELKDGIAMNTTGTKRALDIAKSMRHLVAFIHLSTAFCYPDYERLEEKVHDPPADPQDLMRLIEWVDPKGLVAMTPSLLNSHPNSYTYSKRLAEALVRDQYPNLPVVIARPSIVTPSQTEPVEGWVDNLNGPIGLMVGAGKGVIRSMHCNGDYHAEVIPVDIAINALIVIAFRIGTQTERPEEIPVYNITTSDDKYCTWAEVLDHGKQTVRKYPFEGPLWYPDGNIHKNKLIHKINVFLFHLIPAYFIDFLMFLFRQRRFMVRIQNRISVGLEVLQYFTTREWWFETKNFKDLYEKLSPDDRETFPMDLKSIDIEQYIEKSMLGGRQYCMKESLSNLPKARLQNNILYFLDKLFTILFYYMIFSWIISYSDSAKQVVEFLKSFLKNLPVIGSVISQDTF